MFTVSNQPLSPSARRLRWFKLGLCAAPILGAFYYRYSGTRSPFGCPLHQLTGIPCPTCGMTRGFIATAGGHFAEAVSYHAFAPLLFVGLVMVEFHLIWELRSRCHIHAFYQRWLTMRWLHVCTVVLLGYHAYRLYLLAATGKLAPAVEQSPLGQLLF